MNTISFKNVLPHVFSENKDMQSDVWRREVEFLKEKTYLIEADSGKGKSTFCSYVIGYRHDYDGQIMFDGKDVATMKVPDWTNIRRQNISYLFQELRLFPELTAFENVEIKNKLTAFKMRSEIEQWFERLDIADKMNVKIGFMSFGQQQRVALIRALVQPFDFIIADEPISHLDERNSVKMGEIMMEEARRQGAGVIVTSIGKHMEMPYDGILKL